MVNLVGTYVWYTCIEKQISIGCCKINFFGHRIFIQYEKIYKQDFTTDIKLLIKRVDNEPSYKTELPH